MCADIFEIDMEIDCVEHSSLLGGAALGLELLGKMKDIERFVDNSARIVSFNPEKSDLYLEKYNRYKYWYEATKPNI
jgi:gluconokinase